MADTMDVSRVEAPVTMKTYLMCAFAAFGGIFFGYDSGYINGVMGMRYFIEEFEGLVGAFCSHDFFQSRQLTLSLIGLQHYP